MVVDIILYLYPQSTYQIKGEIILTSNINSINWKHEIKRVGFGVVAAVIMAANIKTFVNAGGLYPGGFNGVTLLIQTICQRFFHLAVPFAVISLTLNAIPALISFKAIGVKFTSMSCIVIILTSIMTDVIPAQPITYDPLLISIFGGLINGFAVSLCLIGNTSSGGTDFIAIFFSERKGVDVWNYVLAGNAIVLFIAGLLFGWDKALYSIIFQFTSTQVVQLLHQKYKKHTLFIITTKPETVYREITSITNHSATQFSGTGCYTGENHTMIYSVVSRDEAKVLVKKVKETDPQAFINVIKTDYINGRFYQRTDY